MNIYKLEDILEDNSNPPDPIIGDGLLLPQTLLMITGLPKSKKSILAANLAISIASGNSFSFFEIKKTFKVLILSAEGGYFPNRDRFKKMCAAIKFNGSENLNLGFDSRFKIENDEEYQEVKDIIDKFKPEVLVIDPFVKFHHKDENSATEMGVILERLRNLIEDHKLSIILVHHLGKNPRVVQRAALLSLVSMILVLLCIKPKTSINSRLNLICATQKFLIAVHSFSIPTTFGLDLKIINS